jgi:hypothetical protein
MSTTTVAPLYPRSTCHAVSIASEPLLPPLASGVDIDLRDQLITRQTLARWFNISPRQLGVWARRGVGPRAIRVGACRIRYRLADCLDYLRAQSADVCPDVRKNKKEKLESLSQA